MILFIPISCLDTGGFRFGHEDVVFIGTRDVVRDLVVENGPGDVVGDETGGIDLEGMHLDGVIIEKGVELLLEAWTQLKEKIRDLRIDIGKVWMNDGTEGNVCTLVDKETI